MSPEVVLLIAGLVFLGVGLLGGGIEISELRVPPIKPALRIVFSTLGGLLFLLGILITLGIMGPAQPRGATSGGGAITAPPPTAPLPAATASPEASIATPAPSATAQATTPTELLIPTPTLDRSAPPQLGTPIPAAAAPISADRAVDVIEVARWGKGVPNSIAWAPGAPLFAVGSQLGIYLYDASTGQQLRFIPTDDEVTSVAISPDGVIAAGLEGGEVQQWALRGGLLPILTGFERSVHDMAFAPDGQTLAATACELYDAQAQTCQEGAVRVWRVTTGEVLFELGGHTTQIESIAFSPDGTILISSADDKTVRLWDTMSGELLRTINTDTSLYEAAYATNPELPIIALAAYEEVKLWRADSGAELPSLKVAPESWTRSVSFAPDGRTLVAAALDGTIRLFDLDGADLGELDRFRARSITYSADGRSLLALGENGSLRLWDLASRQELWRNELFLNAIPAVAALPDQETVVIGQNNAPAQLRRLRDGALVRTLGQAQDVRLGWTLSIAVSPDGATVATGGWPYVIQLWRAEDGALLHTLEGHEDGIRSLAFSEDGAYLVSGSEDGTIRLWSVASGELVQTLDQHTDSVYRVTFSPDGTLLASGAADNMIRTWSFDGEQLIPLRILAGHTEAVRALSFSPDGATLASASPDNTVRLWSVADGGQLARYDMDGGWVTLAYTPDGSAIVVGDNDGQRVLIVKADDGTILSELPVATRFAFLDNLALSGDGRTIMAGLWNGQVYLWRIRS